MVAELKLPKIDFIKIDVEGYEQFVIDGLIETINKNNPSIVFEFDRNYQLKRGLDVFSIFKTLEKYDYGFFVIGSHRLSGFHMKPDFLLQIF